MNELVRKPVAPAAVKAARVESSDSYGILGDLIDDYLEPPPGSTKASATGEFIKQQPRVVPRPIDRELRAPLLRAHRSSPMLVSRPTDLSVVSASSEPTSLTPSNSKWKAVFDETVYFAGGLISHPFESTKHYSILRHSPAIAYYKGPSTNVTMSVFGDTALPADRSFWIQRKGFSGNMGMAASALMRTTSNWIDVTPSVEVPASSAPEGDERAWQRDIKKFLKKAAKDKRLSKHVIRETCVLRIPAAAEDGYLRIVMCTGQDSKKSLCPSPTFRLASTSSDVSVLRGASLTTLPLEVGLKAASVVGNLYAERIYGPAQAIVQTQIDLIQTARDMKDQVGGSFDPERDVTYGALHGTETLEGPPNIVGSDAGPEKPFPITFDGKVVPGTGQSWMQAGTPTANLSSVPEHLLLRLGGIYIGWAAIEQSKTRDEMLPIWYKAVVTVSPSPHASPMVVQRKIATVHLIYDFGNSTTFFNAKLKVILAAFLRATPKPSHPRLPTDILPADKEIAIASLNRPRWWPDACLQILSAEKSQRTMTDKYVGFRSEAQRRIDSLPMHYAGIRTERASAKDEAYGQGGYYIRR
ncbi:hypothetical protein F4802DRAFT_497584 [Xylaria palmicola]|nr:hypothetical protein F4802DRAFT_497584 [Xylaria palmicola]